jgi:glycosyltransferase involved in cell wall biosynthesis
MTSTLTICVPTIGRPSLRHTLDSIRRQKLVAGDRVLVVFDSHGHGHHYDLQELVEGYGFEYHEFDGGRHFMGNPQFNHGMTLATTDYFCGLGDDDVYVDGAIERLRKALKPGRVLLHQFYSPLFQIGQRASRFVLWDEPKLQVAHISGCCMVAPTASLVPVKDDERIEVDYEWIVDTVAKSGKKPVWMRDCLIIARPDLRDGEPVHRGVSSCQGCGVTAYLEDLDDRLCAECEGSVLRQFIGASA